MDCIYIAPLSKALYNLCLSFTGQRRLAALQGTDRLVRSNRGLGVLLKDTSTCPGWDRTGNPPTARRQLLPPEPYRPQLQDWITIIEKPYPVTFITYRLPRLKGQLYLG